MEFFISVFSEFAEFNDKKIVITAKGFEPQPPLVWGTGSLNVAQCVLQWFIWFPEFAEFSENFPHLGKTPLWPLPIMHWTSSYGEPPASASPIEHDTSLHTDLPPNMTILYFHEAQILNIIIVTKLFFENETSYKMLILRPIYTKQKQEQTRKRSKNKAKKAKWQTSKNIFFFAFVRVGP